MSETIKVGAVQAEPAWLNLPESVKKVTSLVEQAGKDGVNVLGFPELFVPGYPWSIWTEPYLDNTGMFHEYMANSLVKDSPEMAQICEAVKKAGKIVLHRRKIKPTGVERAIWGDGDGLINVVDSPFGKIGGLNCWEHFQPLLRYHEYSQGVDIHIAGWPPFFGKPENIPILYTTTGEGDRLACQFMAMEGACFVVVSTQVMGEKGREKLKLVGSPHITSGGGFAMIFGPDGTPLVDPLDSGEEGILTAEIQLSTIDYAKNMLDVVGHYSRPDLLSLNVNLKGAKPVRYI
ncbi:CN hydrolase domain-containing protein [Trichoderma simmonsii]|uniref:nitrilase n=1 Tax=Trichoderma simmonsii TaxID=1491479 RepID=A0A8G0PJ51_9HYPO|nr:CN hydrolase domain-containing protein [Trichoderma simmonsii]